MSILFGSIPHRVLVGQAHTDASQFQRKSVRRVGSRTPTTTINGSRRLNINVILSMITDFESPQPEPQRIAEFHVHVAHVHFPDGGR